MKKEEEEEVHKNDIKSKRTPIPGPITNECNLGNQSFI
jgi:hypothetical protein